MDVIFFITKHYDCLADSNQGPFALLYHSITSSVDERNTDHTFFPCQLPGLQKRCYKCHGMQEPWPQRDAQWDFQSGYELKTPAEL